MNAQEAGDAPRFRHVGSSKPEGGRMTDGGEVWLESGISSEVVRELLSRGHRVVKHRGSFGGYQGIWIDAKQGVMFGGSESRSDGAAIVDLYIDYNFILISWLIGLAASTLAGILPARKSLKLSPVEVIREG